MCPAPQIFIRVLLCLLVMAGTAAADMTVNQEFTLHPGWNSIFIDVQPLDKDPAHVFAALPQESTIWCRTERTSRVEYILDPAEEMWNQEGWHVYLKSESQSFLSNLHAILGDNLYLIYLEGNADVALTITGTPATKRLRWVPDSFNLVGFSLAPAGITFQDFFAAAAAHAGQVIYQLNSTGFWEVVADPSSQSLQPGVAYWVYSDGPSDFQGPLDVVLPSPDGIDFSAEVVRQKLIIRNLTERAKTVQVELLSPEISLTYQLYDETDQKYHWPKINSMGNITLEPLASKIIELFVRREEMNPTKAEGLLEISDNEGVLVHVPVWVDRYQSGNTPPITIGSLSQGLWVGTATLDKVSQANDVIADIFFDLQLVKKSIEEALFTSGEQWKFLAPAESPAGDWYAPDFDDSGWAEVSTLPVDESGITGTRYYRRKFTPPDPVYTKLSFHLEADDGVAVYLNGRLMYIDNLTLLHHQSLAQDNVVTVSKQRIDIPVTLLKDGENVIAVEVHQYTENSEDLYFNLELFGESEEILIPFKSDGWSLYDKGHAPADDQSSRSWHARDYSQDGDWTSVTAPAEPETAGKAIYLRNEKTLPTFSTSERYSLQVLYDDGVVVHLTDGTSSEPLILNMADDEPIDYHTQPLVARRSPEESVYAEIDITNYVANMSSTSLTLAAEVHQHPSEYDATGVGMSTPSPTAAPLDLRLLVHVDGGGNIRLLKEVYLMSDPDNGNKPILLTDPSKLHNYKGLAWRDGEQISRRLSTVGFEFLDDDSSNPGTKAMSSSGATLGCTLVVPKIHPTHPFLHRYHPDHDGLNERFEAFDDDDKFHELPEITRSINMAITSKTPDDSTPPGWGRTLFDGVYTETLSGVHKNDILLEGSFTLNRVSESPDLNP